MDHKWRITGHVRDVEIWNCATCGKTADEPDRSTCPGPLAARSTSHTWRMNTEGLFTCAKCGKLDTYPDQSPSCKGPIADRIVQEINLVETFQETTKNDINALLKAAQDVLYEATERARQDPKYRAGMVPVTWASLNALKRAIEQLLGQELK